MLFVKPVQLKMTAFGPYKDTEIIDFQELKEQRLFVISGNTGAGKTTIFDGICFALYGTASGQDRENNSMLRSDFAADDVHTAVEFIFQLKGKTYRILRQPGHVKQGNKTKTGERYELFQLDGDNEVSIVDRQIVSEIDKKIESLIGLTQDQFKQIVMLPQGEFRKLLTSQTENKEDILRRLFKTEPYKVIIESLRKRKNSLQQAFQQESHTRDTLIQQLTGILPVREDGVLFQVLAEEHYNTNQVMDALQAEIAYYEKQITLDQLAYERAYEAHHKKQTELHEANAWNQRFDELEQKKKNYAALQQQLPTYEQKEKELKAAEQAQGLIPYEERVKEWRQSEKQVAERQQQAEHTFKQAGDKFKQTEAAFTKAEAQKPEREEAARRLEWLRSLKPMVQELDKNKQQLIQLEKDSQTAANQLEQSKNQEQKVKAQLQTNETELRKLESALSDWNDKHQSLTALREQAKTLKSFLDWQEKGVLLQKNRTMEQHAYTVEKEGYQRLETQWLSNQAAVLAAHLHDGEACPVCGSSSHPNRATSTTATITKDTLDLAKKQLEKKEQAYREAEANVKSNQTMLKDLEQQIIAYGFQSSQARVSYDQITVKGKQLKLEVEALEEKQKQRKKLNASQEQLEQHHKQLQVQLEKLTTEHQTLQNHYASHLAVYQERLKQIPSEIQQLSDLEKQFQATGHTVKQLNTIWENAQKHYHDSKEAKTKATTHLEHLIAQMKETKERRQQVETQFSAAIAKAGFESEKAYEQARLTDEDRLKLQQTIDVFKQNLSHTNAQIEELQQVLKGKTKVDLTELEQAVNELKQYYEAALNKRNQSREYKKSAAAFYERIIQATKQLAETEKQLGIASDLYDVIRGNNSQKVSLERYLQIEYLEQIIEAANERLRHISNGQFHLIRSERQESHGRQSGLGLDVYDAYTGQTRDVKTLSGGEKFNASLCLALGMSDVIQSFQGNISIETMFIDEGFGSLDEESLNKAIDTLIDLQQSGRLIGVISHVQELKNLFPAVLEVKKLREGYSETRFILK